MYIILNAKLYILIVFCLNNFFPIFDIIFMTFPLNLYAKISHSLYCNTVIQNNHLI